MKPVFIKLGRFILYLLLWFLGGVLGPRFVDAVTHYATEGSDLRGVILSPIVFFVPFATGCCVWFIKKKFSDWHSKSAFAKYKSLLVVPIYITILWLCIGVSIVLVYVLPPIIGTIGRLHDWLFGDTFGFAIIMSIGMAIFLIWLLIDTFRSMTKVGKVIGIIVSILVSVGLLLTGCLTFLMLKQVSGRLENVIIVILWYAASHTLVYGAGWVLDKFENKNVRDKPDAHELITENRRLKAETEKLSDNQQGDAESDGVDDEYEEEPSCSKCGNKDVLPMVDGYPDEDFMKEIENGDVVWGGYHESGDEFFCRDCDSIKDIQEEQTCPFCGLQSSIFISGRTWKCRECEMFFQHGEQSHICPSCNSSNVIPIVYGFPSARGLELYREGKIALGGCVATTGYPVWECKGCEHNFGSLDI